MQRLFFNPWMFTIIALLAIITIISLHQTSQKTNITSQQLGHLETEIKTLKTDVASSAAQASSSAHPFTKERIARDELLWQKPGETVIELPAVTPKPLTTTPLPTQTPWQMWKKLLTE